jgi:5-methylcytosine-specific restriction endonuclease McrA
MSNSILEKHSRNRVAPRQYAKLRKEILERDGWRCQTCGRSTNLDVHHVKRRSALGDDTEANLITLCRECHRVLHGAPPPSGLSDRVRKVREPFVKSNRT